MIKQRSITISLFTLMLLTFVLFLTGVTQAQDSDQDADPPSRVARLNFIEGAVSFQPAGTSDWVDANPNRPLTTGDQLWVDENSRGELHLGGSVLRISAQTGISFLNLTDQAVQIQVAQGTADLRVLRLEENESYEIDTPNLAFTVLRTGEYRIDVNGDGTSSIVTVENGAGEVTAGGQAYNASPGQQYTFSGTDQVGYDAEGAPDPDDFQRWNLERDQREDKMVSAQYVSRDVIGYEDLDDHGTWRDDPTYGHVWIPSGVAEGWAPYHNGHWSFVAPWGWTWVEDEPWGFAPFHYGRWAVVGGSWGWVPGPVPVVGAVYVRPVYAPALVAFVGGGGFAASIEIGGGGGVGVAWFPLGPRDVWVPSYHVSAVYMANVNITNSRVINRTEVTTVYNTTIVNNRTNVNVNRTYMYQSTAGAVTAVPQAAFKNGEPVAKASVRVDAQSIHNARVVQTAAIVPSPRAVTGPNAAAKASARPPATLASRPVVTKMAPSARAIPVGQTKPASRSAYRSMPNAKPATALPPSKSAAPSANKPTAEKPAAAQPGKLNAAPAERVAPTNNTAVQPNRTQPPAREIQPPARTNETPANKPVPPNKSEAPTRENQPAARTTEVPANKPAPPNKAEGPTRENQPPARTTELPANKPAPPNKAEAPIRENQPPARTNAAPNKPQPEAKPVPRPPAAEAKKPSPPPEKPVKEAKPQKESNKDKNKDKDKDKEPKH